MKERIMRDTYFEFFANILCCRCRVAYPARRRSCPCCNEYNPAYLADPAGDFDNHYDFTENDFNDEEEECPY